MNQKRLVVAVFVAVSLVLAACGRGANSSEVYKFSDEVARFKTEYGTLVVAVRKDPELYVGDSYSYGCYPYEAGRYYAAVELDDQRRFPSEMVAGEIELRRIAGGVTNGVVGTSGTRILAHLIYDRRIGVVRILKVAEIYTFSSGQNIGWQGGNNSVIEEIGSVVVGKPKVFVELRFYKPNTKNGSNSIGDGVWNVGINDCPGIIPKPYDPNN